VAWDERDRASKRILLLWVTLSSAFLMHHKPAENQHSANREVLRLLEEMSDLPVLDHRSIDEILDYFHRSCATN
jgi:hypothetical protein